VFCRTEPLIQVQETQSTFHLLAQRTAFHHRDVHQQSRLTIKTNLKQSQEFEDNHDNDDHSNDVKDVSVHAGDSYQSECGGQYYPD